MVGSTLHYKFQFFLLAFLLSAVISQPEEGEDEEEGADEDAVASPSHKAGSSVTVGSSNPRLRGSTSEATAASCKCLDALENDPEEPACSCDLLAVDLDKDLPHLGLDRCAAVGTCEACPHEELVKGYCSRTKWRQRVVCSRCHATMIVVPRICSHGMKIFWKISNLKRVANRSVVGEHLFYRSCRQSDDDANQAENDDDDENEEDADAREEISDSSAAAQPRKGPLLSWHRWSGESDTVDDKFAGEQSQGQSAPARRGPLLNGARAGMRNGSSAFNRTSHTVGRIPKEHPDESTEVICFVALNSIAFAVSFLSLRRQQRAIMEKTMGVLFDAPAVVENKSSSNAQTSHLETNLDTPSAMPDSIGRSIEAVASAVARTGNAIERAVTEELTKASLASSKKN